MAKSSIQSEVLTSFRLVLRNYEMETSSVLKICVYITFSFHQRSIIIMKLNFFSSAFFKFETFEIEETFYARVVFLIKTSFS